MVMAAGHADVGVAGMVEREGAIITGVIRVFTIAIASIAIVVVQK